MTSNNRVETAVAPLNVMSQARVPLGFMFNFRKLCALLHQQLKVEKEITGKHNWSTCWLALNQ